MNFGTLLFTVFLLAFQALKSDASYDWNIGIGIHDVTGPIAGVNFMGYAMIDQVGRGIHTRCRARCFIFGSEYNSLNNETRIVYCSVDATMIPQHIKTKVIKGLAIVYGPDLYTEKNVLLSGTHTHASPGGFHEYLLYSITSLGYLKESGDLLVTGIVQAISRAHKSMKKSHLRINSDRLWNANRNRSPTAYMKNPKWLRDRYSIDGDTDKIMNVLSIERQESEYDENISNLRGLISFFSVHCTSMNNSNPLTSGDNKGYASYLAEKEMNAIIHGVGASSSQYRPYTHPEMKNLAEDGKYFVAAFGQTQEGDVSPNTRGSFCLDTGKPCDKATSTCPDSRGRPRNELCHAQGPGRKNDEKSTRVIGMRQYLKARELMTGGEKVFADLQFGHSWVDFSKTTVVLTDGSEARTCPAARGFSFAAGTTDGPGAFDFFQSDNSTKHPFWNFVRSFIKAPGKGQKRCHSPKPILLDTGEIKLPYAWEPSILDIQIFRMGHILILAVPAEFTTMAGRILKEEVSKVFTNAGIIEKKKVVAIIAGLSNSYAGYVTTYDEYQVQRYEGASTIFGPHTLQAYVQEFKRLAMSMIPPGRRTPLKIPPKAIVKFHDFSKHLLSFMPPVAFDSVPPGKSFGQVVAGGDVLPFYQVNDTVKAIFYAGHPRNVAKFPAMQLERSFARIEKYVGPSLRLLKQKTIKFVSNHVARRYNLGGVSDYDWIITSGKNNKVLYLNISSTPKFTIQAAQSSQIEPSFNQDLFCISHMSLHDIRFFPCTYGKNAGGKIFWDIVRDDDDWDLKFRWSHPLSPAIPISHGQVEWKITERPDESIYRYSILNNEQSSNFQINGLYRIKYIGAHKSISGKIRHHQGVSSPFVIGDSKYTSDFSNFRNGALLQS